jgi:hypothetical protein
VGRKVGEIRGARGDSRMERAAQSVRDWAGRAAGIE